MGVVLDEFFKTKRFLPDTELCAALGWSAETLKAKRARREAPPSLKVKAIHLTRFDDLEKWMIEQGSQVNTSAGQETAAADLLK